MLDLREVRVRDAGHRRDLTHRQLSQLSLPADEFAQQILRRLRPWIHGHHLREQPVIDLALIPLAKLAITG